MRDNLKILIDMFVMFFKKYSVEIYFVIVSFFVRIGFMLKEPLFLDESFSWLLSGHSYPEIVEITAKDVHPPLYYFLLKNWINVFGDNLMLMRFTSLIFWGVSVICIIYIIRKLNLSLNKRIFVYSFIIFIPVSILASVYVRMYSILLALSLLAFIVLVKYFVTRKLKFLIAYSVLMLVALYIDNLAIFSFVSVNIFYLINFFYENKRNRKNFLKFLKSKEFIIWSLSQFIVFVLFLPWLFVMWRQFSVEAPMHIQWVSPMSLDSFFRMFSMIFGVNHFDPTVVSLITGILCFPLFIWCLYKFFKEYFISHKESYLYYIAGFVCFFSIFLVVLLSFKQSIIMPRTFYIPIVFFLIIFFSSLKFLESVWARRIILSLVTITLVCMTFGFTIVYKDVFGEKNDIEFLKEVSDDKNINLVITSEVESHSYPYTQARYMLRNSGKTILMDKNSDTKNYDIYTEKDFVDINAISSNFYFFEITDGKAFACPESKNHEIVMEKDMVELFYKFKLCKYVVISQKP
jgi:uncharacterized membrane protein